MKNVKFLLLTLIFILILCLTGCGYGSGQDNTIATEKGDMLKYDLDSLTSKGLNGFYVKNEDNTFSPVMTGMENHDDNMDISSVFDKKKINEKFIWFADTDTIKLSKIIPKITKRTPLVGFFEETDEMPDEYYLEKYIPLGYTLGCTFLLSDDQSNISLSTDTVCSNSTMQMYIEKEELKGEYEVVKFNETKDVPLKNIDGDTGLLVGLEKNKPYQIGYYDGTTYNSTTSDNFMLKADTQAFKATEIIKLDIPFKKSTGNYFQINLPDNLEEGYYYINDYGFFYYSK